MARNTAYDQGEQGKQMSGSCRPRRRWVNFHTVSAFSVVLMFVLVFEGVAFANSLDLTEVYQQHEKARTVSILMPEDRKAAQSLAIDKDHFASHLPVIRVQTYGHAIPGEPLRDEFDRVLRNQYGQPLYSTSVEGNSYIEASLELFDSDGTTHKLHANRLSDEPVFKGRCRVAIRGNSSRHFDKKNYKVSLVNKKGDDKASSLLGMAKSATWVLHGPSYDRSLMRNYLTYGLAREFMDDFVPETRYCELFINNDYQGLYVLTEPIKVGEGLVDLTQNDPRAGSTSWLVRIDGEPNPERTITTFLNYTLRLPHEPAILYPNPISFGPEVKASILSELSFFEKSLFSYDYDTRDYGYQTAIDVESFIDTFLMNELTANDDYSSRSTYMYKDVKGKITAGPLWDYNNAYGYYALEQGRAEAADDTEGFRLVERFYFYMLFKDENFVFDVIDRYRKLREDVLSDEHILAFIQETRDFLGPAIDRNYLVWGSVFQPETLRQSMLLEPMEKNPRSYDEALDQLESFILKRTAWMDRNIENLRQFCHESAVKKFNH